MWVPFFKVRDMIKAGKVHVFSSNYSLYGDLSARVMKILDKYCSDMEVYSIDEAFLKFEFHGQSEESLTRFAADLRAKILKGVGLPVSVGIAPTKTLSKLANHWAKRHTREGVFVMMPNHPVMEKIPISKIWGVGRRYNVRLNAIGIKTVAQLVRVEAGWIKKEFGVVGLRMLKELQGFPCYVLEDPPTERKQTLVSRSFAKDVYELDELKGSISSYALRLGEKLRQHQQAASALTVFLWANKYKNKRKDGRTLFTTSVALPEAISDGASLAKHTTRLVEELYLKGTNYKKAGIMADGLVPQNQLQIGLLDSNIDRKKKLNTLFETIDQLNQKHGRNTVYLASCNTRKPWQLKQEHKSKKYTTCWNELLCIQL